MALTGLEAGRSVSGISCSQEWRSPSWRPEDPSRGSSAQGIKKNSQGTPNEFDPPGRNRACGLQASELQSLFQLSYGSLLVKHGDACARKRYQLIGYQVDEHICHRAVERLEGERARSPERVLTPLILGTRSVGKPAIKLWRR